MSEHQAHPSMSALPQPLPLTLGSDLSGVIVAAGPTSLTYVEAASVPVIAVTTQQALFDRGHLEAGQTVAIQGATDACAAYLMLEHVRPHSRGKIVLRVGAGKRERES